MARGPSESSPSSTDDDATTLARPPRDNRASPSRANALSLDAPSAKSTSIVASSTPSTTIGRYTLDAELAAGGMATVHLGRLRAPGGFRRTIAIKRLHPQYAKDPEFVAMMIDEARVVAHIRHRNVVPTLDVVADGGELFLVMEYVEGESLARLLRATRDAGERCPVDVAVSIVAAALDGLHAAHEATGDDGLSLGVVHRDVSPQNVLVGVDGVARVLDFGVAKAAQRVQTTRDGQLKGKLGYMAPEQVQGVVTRRTDVFAASIVLWEALVGRRLFDLDQGAVATLQASLTRVVEPPGSLVGGIPSALDAVVMRGLDRDPRARWPTARDMARALEAAIRPASTATVGAWVERWAEAALARRATLVAMMEGRSAEMNAPRAPREEPPSSTASREATTFRSAAAATPARRSIDPPLAATPTHRSIAPILAVALVVAFAVVAIASIVARETRTSLPAAAAAASTGASITPATIAASATAATPAPSIGASELSSIASHAASTPAPSAPVATPTSKPAPPRPVRPTSAPPKPNCDPPYVYDAKGTRRYKPECL